MKKLIIITIILLILFSFGDKKLAEKTAVSYQDEKNKVIPFEIVYIRHKIWSERVGIGRYDVYIDYTANHLRLTSRYKVENLVVVDACRVSE